MSKEPSLSINSIGSAAIVPSPGLAQRLLTLPLVLLLPCQTQDLLLGHQLWLIPPVQIILVQIAPSLNLASRRKE